MFIILLETDKYTEFPSPQNREKQLKLIYKKMWYLLKNSHSEIVAKVRDARRTNSTGAGNTQKFLYYLLVAEQGQTVKKGAAPCKRPGWKKLWNTGGGQEMAVMVGQWQKF